MFSFPYPDYTRRATWIRAACALALASTLCAQPARAATQPAYLIHNERPGILDRAGFVPRTNTLPGNVDVSRFRFDAMGRAVPNGLTESPFWTLKLPSDPLDGKAYTDILLGSFPTDGEKSNIGIYVLGWNFKFSNGLETSAFDASCGDTTSVYDRFLASPIMADASFTSNGVSVGNRQYVDALQTAEFAGLGFPSGWRTNFVPQTSEARVVTVTVPAADGFAKTISGCKNPFGEISQAWFDKVDRQVIQQLGFSHAQVAFSLFNNTVMYGTSTKDCCIIGYHSAYSGSTYDQVYGVGSYVESGLFSGLTDVAALSHELAELTNDPYVNNATPAWGHIGQVSGCQGNFEVGDPLSGTQWAYALGGFTYHLQDLAFYSWFYRLTPANGYHVGTDGKYSFRGTFAGVQPACKS